MQQPEPQNKNARTAWILFSVALVFFLGIVAKQVFFR